MKHAKKKKNGFLKVVIILLLVCIIGAGGFGANEVFGVLKSSDMREVDIAEGAGTAAIAAALKESGIINSALLFRAYSKYTGADGAYQYGTFSVVPSSGYSGVVETLQKSVAQAETTTVTIPEGYNAFQIGAKLEEIGVCTKDEFIDALMTHSFDVPFMSEIGDDTLKFVRLEGFLFPDTYSFFIGEDVDSIIMRMLTNFEDKVMTDEIMTAVSQSEYSFEEIIIFASIVQKEAFDEGYMPVIAGIFANRMAPDSPIPLIQSCTTDDLIRDYMRPYYNYNVPAGMEDAYNTYALDHLPVGAVGNPGLAAIRAVLAPEETPYYFFCNDKEGTTYFAVTNEEHEANKVLAGLA